MKFGGEYDHNILRIVQGMNKFDISIFPGEFSNNKAFF